MSRIRTTTRRLGTALTVATAAVLLTAGPAAAHVEVAADKAQALAEDVTLSFNAESESVKAGIVELRVVLPKGMSPADVAYGQGPKGWTFTANDEGYTVKGPAVAVGKGAEYSVTVRQLPDAKALAFKTLQTYSDGRIDRWIELSESGGGDEHGHGSPAPVLKLAAAAPGAKPVRPGPTASPTSSETALSPSPSKTPSATEEKKDGNGLSAGVWVGIGAAGVVALTAVGYAVRRRSSAGA
ncbi:DUF1775 domain-containing protein [Streptomyces sp. NPDC000880]